MEQRKKIGFILGPLLFLLAYFLPILQSSPKAHTLLAIFLLVITWWVTECLPIPVTALLIPVLLTIFQIAPVENAFAPFANPIIMLFLGSFVLAKAMSVHALDQKLACSILCLKSIGLRKARILFAFILTTALLSLWVSNTATAAMMYPIALGVLTTLPAGKDEKSPRSFGTILLLATAYAASVGGIGTPVGSPPNLIAIGMAEKLAGYRITFFQWMVVSLFVLVPMLLVLFVFMKFRMRKEKSPFSSARISFPEETQARRGLTRPQKNVLVAFSVTVFLWIFPGFVSLVWGRDSLFSQRLEKYIPESVAAIIGACLLFFLPVSLKQGKFTLSLHQALDIDWGTLLLFGGGLSMGIQMFETGLAGQMGKLFLSAGGQSASLSLIVLLSIIFSIFFTEVTSNTASASMVIPVVIAVSQAASINPLPPVLGSAMACSFAFMLPIATPPNAIIYGSGRIPIRIMMRYGIWFNIFGTAIIWLGIRVIAPLLGLI